MTAKAPAADRTTTTEPLSPRARIATFVALAIGAVFCFFAESDVLPIRWVVVAAVVGVALIPPVSQLLAALLERLRNPSPRVAEWTGIGVGVAATSYLIATAILQGRSLAPRMLDECSYAIGAQLLAHGRLWMPQHPLADFFDSLFLTARPVYSSIYFPGTFVAFAPAVWLGWPTWIIPVVLAGISVGLLYRIVTKLTGDGAAGLLSAAWIVSLMVFRALSVMTMSHIVLLFLGLVLFWLWLRWQESSASTSSSSSPRKRWAWVLAIGAIAGWAAITRPVDAIAYALPVGIAMMWPLRGKGGSGGGGGPSARARVAIVALLIVGAAPFLALQVIHNAGVTGSPFRTAYSEYLNREQPGAEYGIRKFDPAWQPASSTTSPKVGAYYDWVRPYLKLHQPHNFWRSWFRPQRVSGGRVDLPHFLTLIDATMPARQLVLLLPVGIVALFTDRRRLVLAATLPLYAALYVFNPFFLPHYPVVVAPAVILLSLPGADTLARLFARRRLSNAVRVALYAGIFAMSLTSFWEARWAMTPSIRPRVDGFQEGLPQSHIQTAIELQAETPAVVLYGVAPELWTEMVYNTDVAWPDDAPIIRAHDLGPRIGELVDYYGERQPERTIYRFDWSRGSLQRLGKAGELRAWMKSIRPASPATPVPPS